MDMVLQKFFAELTWPSSLGVPVGNAILISTLQSSVPQLAPSVPPDAVVVAGPLDLASLTNSAAELLGLRQAWALAVSRVNIFLVVIICISVPTACGMEWLNLKKISKEREIRKREEVKNSDRRRSSTEKMDVGGTEDGTDTAK